MKSNWKNHPASSHSLSAGHRPPDSPPHRKVECLPEREMLLPTGEGKLLPRCRSSIERLQGLDLSIELSTLFSKLSKSNLKGNRNSGLDGKDSCCFFLPDQHAQVLVGPKRLDKERKKATRAIASDCDSARVADAPCSKLQLDSMILSVSIHPKPSCVSMFLSNLDLAKGRSQPCQPMISETSNSYVLFYFNVK